MAIEETVTKMYQTLHTYSEHQSLARRIDAIDETERSKLRKEGVYGLLDTTGDKLDNDLIIRIAALDIAQNQTIGDVVRVLDQFDAGLI